MSFKTLLLLFIAAFFASCQSYTPAQQEAKVELKDQKGLLKQLDKQSDEIEDEYEDVKEDLTEIMQRERLPHSSPSS